MQSTTNRYSKLPYSKSGERTNPLHWIDLPLTPPSKVDQPFRRCLWEWRVWIETTLGVCLLEPEEKFMIC